MAGRYTAIAAELQLQGMSGERQRRSLQPRRSAVPAVTTAWATPASYGTSSPSSPTPSTTSTAAVAFGPVGQAMLSRVNSLSFKVAAMLDVLGTKIAPRKTAPGASAAERMVELTEGLAQLEQLLDEVWAKRRLWLPTSRSNEASADVSVNSVPTNLLDAMNQTTFDDAQVASPLVQGPYLILSTNALASSNSRPVTPLTRRETPGRYQEAQIAPGVGALATARTLAVSAPLNRVSGSLSPVMPRGQAVGLTPPVGLQTPGVLRAPSILPPGTATTAIAAIVPQTARWTDSIAQNANYHLNGTMTPSVANTPRIGYNTSRSPAPVLGQRDRRFSPPNVLIPQMPYASTPGPPPPVGMQRNLSAPRHTPPIGFETRPIIRPPQEEIPVRQQSTGLWTPSSRRKENLETKIRNWLATIPIGNGSERGWDDAQILNIADFAQEHQLDQLSAEGIYQKYVEYQVARSEDVE